MSATLSHVVGLVAAADQDNDVTPRGVAWLTARDRRLLRGHVATALPHASDPVTVLLLDAALTELTVSPMRGWYTEAVDDRHRQRHGLPPDTQPVRLSHAEAAALLDLPGLPPHLRAHLRRAQS